MSISRRHMLAALGGSAALLPFVPLLEADADPLGDCKRLLLVYTPDGTIYDRWRPSGGETDFQLSPILSPLEALRDRIVVLDGITLQAGGSGEDHARNLAGLWTGSRFASSGGNESGGWADGHSVDQRITSDLDEGLAFPSVELAVQPETFGVSGADARNRMIYAGPSSPITPEHDPVTAFERMLGDLDLDAAQREQLRARRQSAIDVVKAELDAMAKKLGHTDKLKLDKHLQGIRDIESRLTLDATCSSDPPPTLDPWDEPSFPEVGAAQMQLIQQAFACDLTRVASLQWAHAGGRGTRHTWLGIDEYQHIMVHSGTANFQDQIEAIDTWYAQRFAELLGLLDAVEEGTGTMLDNTLVVWGRELGRGYGHNRTNTPFVLAGGAGGALSTGRYLEFNDVQHNRLLVSICRLMGLDGVDTFGDLDNGSGPLPGLV